MPPMKYLNLSIGNRMEHFIGPQMVLSDYASEQEVLAWCKKMDGFIQDRALPFIQSLESTEQWLKYVSREDSAFSFIDLIRVSPDIRYELMMYAALTCHQYDTAIAAAKLFLSQIDIPCYTDDVRERGRQQYQELTALAQSGNDQAVDAFITERKIQNYRFFTGKELVP